MDQTFWIELQTVGNGLEKLSCQINGIYYIGFLAWREQKEADGTIRQWKSAKMRPCQWDKCSVCHPEQGLEIF